MNPAAVAFSALWACVVFSAIYAGFALSRELAMWNWIARGRSGGFSKRGALRAGLSFLGGMQEDVPGLDRLSRYLHKNAAAAFGAQDPGRAAWLAAKEFSGLAAGALLFWLLKDWMAALAAGLAGFWLPDLIVRERHIRRQERIRRELPDMLDLLSLGVEGGLSVDASFAQVGGKIKEGEIADEIGRMQGEIRFGARRHQAWREMAARTGNSDLREVMEALVQADALGTGLAQSIKGLAGQMRVRRRQQVEELAHKAPVKMLFPLVLCIFPAVFLILLGPVLLQLLAQIS